MGKKVDYDYRDMGGLAELFLKHAEEVEKMREEFKNKFYEDYPDEKIPNYMDDTFNVSRALSSICLEIALLKIRMRDIEHPGERDSSCRD